MKIRRETPNLVKIGEKYGIFTRRPKYVRSVESSMK